MHQAKNLSDWYHEIFKRKGDNSSAHLDEDGESLNKDQLPSDLSNDTDKQGNFPTKTEYLSSDLYFNDDDYYYSDDYSDYSGVS